MNEINHMIITLILLAPLAGAILVALVPDRSKLPNWIALLTTLLSFGLALHLPAHFNYGRPASNTKSTAPGSRIPPSSTTSAWTA